MNEKDMKDKKHCCEQVQSETQDAQYVINDTPENVARELFGMERKTQQSL